MEAAGQIDDRAELTLSRKRRLLRLVPVVALVVAAPVTAVVLASAGGSARGPRARSPVAQAPATRSQSPGARGATVAHDRRPVAAHPVMPAGVARMLGQMIVARFAGPRPSRSFLARLQSGQIGGVILFADNLTGGLGATRALTGELQQAARKGGNPPLLIMTDQEGGAVRRLPGPPEVAPSEMTSDSVALEQGRATGRLLRSVGVDLDLAPVADVERVPGSFLGTRSFGSDPDLVAGRACAFAQGLASEGVGYTLKHFPGLGRATSSTDTGLVSIDASAAALRDDYPAYLACASNPRALVMISSAIYPNLSGPLPAVMSPATYQRELRTAIRGPLGPTISDDLQASGLAGQASPARHAIAAGLDLAMYAQTERASAEAYSDLLAAVRSGHIGVARIRDAAQRIQALKHSLGA